MRYLARFRVQTSRYSPPASNMRMGLFPGLALRIALSVRGVGQLRVRSGSKPPLLTPHYPGCQWTIAAFPELREGVHIEGVRGDLRACLELARSHSGGRCEIRTHEGVAPLPVFKTGALDHSANLPIT